MEPFGKYQLIRRVGAGGMAEVFLARTAVAQGLAKELVIKKIRPAHAHTREFVTMFVAEARIALGLNHPNIVQVFDFGQVGDTFFLAMEHIDGVDGLALLQTSVRQGRPIPLSLCAYIVQEMAKGLDYAHRKTDEFGEPLGIVHRDVSPQNVLVSWEGAVKIVDFGIARARDVDEEEGVVKGKYSYMAPEQARGEAVDRRADVYSAGVVLYELCCGRPLFPGRGKEILAKVKAGAIPRPRVYNPDIPESLEAIILKALATDPGDRYATARDLQLALAAFQFSQAQSAGDLIDSDTLARFLSELVPAAERRVEPPVPAHAPASAPETPDSADISLGPVTDSARLITDPAMDSGASPAGAPATKGMRVRKHVMVLEGHVRGLPLLQKRLGTARAAKLVEQFFAVARDIGFKHEGYVYEAAYDAITVLVGLPVAREDDTSRSIQLALALIDALDGIGHDIEPELRLSVGVQRGVAAVFYRDSGMRDNEPGEVELAPEERSLAQRLARQAPGAEVLVGSQVYRVARHRWNFEPVSAQSVRLDDAREAGDDAQTARVFRLRGPKERAERLRERAEAAHEIVGRDLELKALGDAYRDVMATRGTRLIWLTGEAGVGKRTIVNAFLAEIPQGEAVVMRATTQVATLYTPYALIADLARDMLGLAEGAEPREVQRRIEQTMLPFLYPAQDDSREARGAMAAVALLLGGRARTKEFDAAEIRERILEVVGRIRNHMMPKKPVLIIGEDLHWADDDSLALLGDVFKQPSRRPVLGVFTSRPDERASRFAAEIGAELMHVGDLDPQSTIQLIARRFAGERGAADAPAVHELAEQIVERTGGNPFFIQEVLDSLIDRGILAVQPGGPAERRGSGLLRWVDRDAPVQVPTSVESLLVTRIDRLPLGQKQALMHAAVFGRACRAEAASEILGRPAREDLDALVARGLLRQADNHYQFRNDMSMTVAYGLLPADERRRLHRAAAAVIERSATFRDGQDSAIIARHLELAGDGPAAAERYIRAASHAMDVGGNSDALGQLSRAVKLLPAGAHERRFVAHGMREQIFARLGRRPKQLREIRHMREAAEALGDPARQAEAHIRLTQFYIDAGKAHTATSAIEPALSHARASGDGLVLAEALRLSATLARLTGDSERALRICDEGLALCGDSREGVSQRAALLNARGGALWSMGKLEASIEAFAEALVIHRMLDMPRKESQSLNNMGIVFTDMGEYEEALAHYRSALKIDQTLGDRAGVAVILSNIGQTYAGVGDIERADRYLRKAIKLAEQTEDVTTAVDATISLGQVCFQRGDSKRAMTLLKRGVEQASEIRDGYQEVRALLHLTLARLEGGGYAAEDLLDLTRVALEMAEKIHLLMGQTYGLAVQGLVLSALGQADQAADASARAVDLQARQNRPVNPEEIFYYHALLCERAGRRDAAVTAIRAAFAELTAKAGRLQDPELAALYAAARIPRAIRDAYERLVTPPAP